MKILGISGSPHKGSTTDQLVQEVLNGVECDKEFVSLSGMRIGCPSRKPHPGMNKSVSDLVNARNEVRMGRKCGAMVKAIAP